MSTLHKAIMFCILGLTINEGALAQVANRCRPRIVHQEIFPGDSPKEIAAAMQTKVTLSPKWDDARILAAFGFANAVADHENVRGVDGAQANYHARETDITIVRSASTGLTIKVRGPGSYAGFWHLDHCD